MAPTALLSVSNKTELLPFAKELVALHNFKIISSGGTAKYLKDNGVPVTNVEEYTGSAEILGGRVKTLHPRIHGGILAKRGNKAHSSDLERENIDEIKIQKNSVYPSISL